MYVVHPLSAQIGTNFADNGGRSVGMVRLRTGHGVVVV
jgi:hypothetical protein